MSETPNALARPDNACLLCPPPLGTRTWRRADDGYRTCDLCLEKLGETLLDVVVRYGRLSPVPGANTDAGGRGAPGFESRSPASDHIILMRDWRSKSCEVAVDGKVYVWDPKHQERLPNGVQGPLEAPGAYVAHREAWFDSGGRAHFEQERPPLSIPWTLASLADLVAEDRDMSGPRLAHAPRSPYPHTRIVWDGQYQRRLPRGVLGPLRAPGRWTREAALDPMHEMWRWLNHQLDYVCRQDWVGDVSEQLHRLLGQLKPLTGDPRIKIGECPNTIDEGEHTRECRAPLFAPTDSSKDDTIRCGGCGRLWPREEWTDLGRLLAQAA
ncbi:MAG TPA: hypothetical protein VIQ30_02130 [Pseudonocardia sp.]